MRLIHLILTGLCVGLTGSIAMAKDKKSEKPMDMQAVMDASSKLAMPGEPHKQFQPRRELDDKNRSPGWNPTSLRWNPSARVNKRCCWAGIFSSRSVPET